MIASEEQDLLIRRSWVRAPSSSLSLSTLVEKFLCAKRAARDSGELAASTVRDYEATCRVLGRVFADRSVESLTPEDFARLCSDLASTRGPVSLCNEIARARVVFKFALDNCLIDRPARCGSAFQKPSRRVLRRDRARRPPKLFRPDEEPSLADARHG